VVPLTTSLGVIEWLDDTQTMKATLEQAKVPRLERIALNFLSGMRPHRSTAGRNLGPTTNAMATLRQGRRRAAANDKGVEAYALAAAKKTRAVLTAHVQGLYDKVPAAALRSILQSVRAARQRAGGPQPPGTG